MLREMREEMSSASARLEFERAAVLRDQIKADLPGTLKAVAAAGYKQVEPYDAPGANALEMIQVAKDLGMAANSSHFAWESVTDPDKAGVTPFAEVLQ